MINHRDKENSCAGAEGELKRLTWPSKNLKNHQSSSYNSEVVISGEEQPFCGNTFRVHDSTKLKFRSIFIMMVS